MTLLRRPWLFLLLAVLLVLPSLARHASGVAYHNLGMCKLLSQLSQSSRQIGVLNSAIDDFRVTRVLYPEKAEALWGLGLSLQAAGDLKASEAALQEYLLTASRNQLTAYLLGSLAFEQGDWQKAKGYWTQGDFSQLIINQAEHALNQLELSEARFLLEAAQETGQPSYILGLRLGQQLSRLADESQAAGYHELKQATCEGAARAYKMAVDNWPEYEPVRISYGVALRRCGYFESALAELNRIDSTSTAHLQAWAQHEAGLTHLLLNQTAQALPYLESAVRLDPENSTYQATLRRARESSAP